MRIMCVPVLCTIFTVSLLPLAVIWSERLPRRRGGRRSACGAGGEYVCMMYITIWQHGARAGGEGAALAAQLTYRESGERLPPRLER